MLTKQSIIKAKDLATSNLKEFADMKPQLGFVFGSPQVFEDTHFLKQLQGQTGTQWVGCSTAGEISGRGVTDDTAVVTAIRFENPDTRFEIALAQIAGGGSFEAGQALAKKLQRPDLTSVVLLSPGVNVNGSQLVEGMTSILGKKIVLTGGLAGDGGKFQKTFTLSAEGVTADHVIGIGLYGRSVQLRHGCMGGWDPFGKVRQVTRSTANVVFELDGKPALDIYKEYLGDHAKDLPASGLMFPFAIVDGNNSETGLIRTILSVDEKAGSLTFAGDVPQGVIVRLMHANTNGLVGGAEGAAKNAVLNGKPAASAFALVVSCVGRKLIMGVNVDEEIEAVGRILGSGCTMAGFYSYGEISPYLEHVGCQLHNQTLTISYITEN